MAKADRAVRITFGWPTEEGPEFGGVMHIPARDLTRGVGASLTAIATRLNELISGAREAAESAGVNGPAFGLMAEVVEVFPKLDEETAEAIEVEVTDGDPDAE